MSVDLLGTLVVLPALGAVALAFLPAAAERTQKVVALAVSTAVFVLSLLLVRDFLPIPQAQPEAEAEPVAA